LSKPILLCKKKEERKTKKDLEIPMDIKASHNLVGYEICLDLQRN